MAWCRPGDKPLSEAMLVSLLTHICVTRPQWIKWIVGITKRSPITISRSTSRDCQRFCPYFGTVERVTVAVLIRQKVWKVTGNKIIHGLNKIPWCRMSAMANQCTRLGHLFNSLSSKQRRNLKAPRYGPLKSTYDSWPQKGPVMLKMFPWRHRDFVISSKIPQTPQKSNPN